MKVKFVFLIMLLLTASLSVNAQLMRAEELERYAKERYGDRWTDAAENLAAKLSLDKNNSLTYEQVIDCGESTKDQLYVMLNYWFTATFNDANSVIKFRDKDMGVIIAQGYVANIAEHVGGTNSYSVSIRPIIKVDIKDHKIRVTYTVQSYDVNKIIGGGVIGVLSDTPSELSREKWGLETCFPFVSKDLHNAKRTSSKALVMTHAFSNVILDKIEEAVKNGIVGNENDDR